ncbi:hypothetical protein BGZ96_003096, partial [Linnemannia gamsii]
HLISFTFKFPPFPPEFKPAPLVPDPFTTDSTNISPLVTWNNTSPTSKPKDSKRWRIWTRQPGTPKTIVAGRRSEMELERTVVASKNLNETCATTSASCYPVSRTPTSPHSKL